MGMKKDADMFWMKVLERMDELEIPSIRQLEERVGVANGTIGTRMNGLKFPTVPMAEGLCRALRWTWIELWTHAGYIPNAGVVFTTVAEQDIIESFRQLNHDRQEIALNILRGLAQGMNGHYTFVAKNPMIGLTPPVMSVAKEHLEEGRYAEALQLIEETGTLEQIEAFKHELYAIYVEQQIKNGKGNSEALQNENANVEGGQGTL
jgi:hypothetical protein